MCALHHMIITFIYGLESGCPLFHHCKKVPIAFGFNILVSFVKACIKKMGEKRCTKLKRRQGECEVHRTKKRERGCEKAH